jgi:hypothetical protein
MIRILGYSAATLLVTASSIGIVAIIASGFVGEDGVRRAFDAMFAQTPAASSPGVPAPAPVAGVPALIPNAIVPLRPTESQPREFAPRSEINFFEKVPVEGTDYVVHTGGAYNAVADIEAARPVRQWCYTSVPSGTPGMVGRIDLGKQDGDAPPVFTPLETFIALKPSLGGLTPARLVEIARSHCRFGRLNPLG